MSYTITIGNAELCADDGTFSVYVPDVALDNAPRFPFDPSENTNSRAPGYAMWANFCEESGLHELFFNHNDGLMREHPGCFVLTRDHLEVVRGVLGRWKRTNEPGWDWSNWQSPDKDDGVRGRDGALARLLWLEWWMDWALTNCFRPAIQNT